MRSMKWIIVFSGVGIFCFSSGCASQRAKLEAVGPREAAPDVILITISTLRADRVGGFGYERDTTPSYDGFASQNVFFKKAFATSSWMMPAHGSIFTSQYPSAHGATHIEKVLGGEHSTLAEVLREKGYFCVGFCCGPRLSEEYGFARGFDLYDDYSVSLMLDSVTFGDERSIDIDGCRTNNLINSAAIRWLENNTHKPFFMFVHYYDNHWDYLPPAPYDRLYDPDYEGPIDGTQIAREPLYSNPPDKRDIRHIVALYDGEVKKTDKNLAEMLEFLQARRLLESSIVIVLGDHGEQFYEHGHTSHHGLFEELIHIPLAVSIPDTQVKGRVIDSLVSQVDIMPTVLDYLEIPIPDRCHGKSLKPLIEGKVNTVNQFVFAEYTGGAVPDTYALRSTRYKCFEQSGDWFAYDLLQDPTEQHRILPHDFPQQVKTLQDSLKQLVPAIAGTTEPNSTTTAPQKAPNSLP